MEKLSYLATFISLIYGLGVANLLAHLAYLVAHEDRPCDGVRALAAKYAGKTSVYGWEDLRVFFAAHLLRGNVAGSRYGRRPVHTAPTSWQSTAWARSA